METIRKRTVSFTMNGVRCSVTVEHRKAQLQGSGRTVDLKPIPKDAIELSICGDSGQCDGRYAELAGSADAPDVARLCIIWDRWHLNGLKAGTAKQNEVTKGLPHDQAQEALIARDLLVDQGYRYGSAWLFEPVPADILLEIDRIMDRIADKRFGKAPSVENAPEAEGDIIDSRDVVTRLEIYGDALRGVGIDPDLPREQQELLAVPAENREAAEGGEIDLDSVADTDIAEWIAEYAALKKLETDVGDPNWQDGMVMVRESHFEEYAEELANDIGAIKKDAGWPNNFINWSAAADALKQDYAEVTFRGETYYVR